MKVRDIIHSRLIFVSGKGGVGKTCVSAAIGKTSASTGKKVLLVEVDNFHASFPSIFSTEILPKINPFFTDDLFFMGTN